MFVRVGETWGVRDGLWGRGLCSRACDDEWGGGGNVLREIY